MWYKNFLKTSKFATLKFTAKKTYPGNPLKQHSPFLSLSSFFFPTQGNWNLTVFKTVNSKQTIFVFSSSNYLFSLPTPQVLTSNNSFNHLFLSNLGPHVSFFFGDKQTLQFRNQLEKVWFFANSFFFTKLKFRGKGYYLYKSRRNTLAFRFGYSHRVYKRTIAVFYRLFSKTEIFLWGGLDSSLNNFGYSLKLIRPYNQYTGKGVRFLRQITYRKLGKVGSYR
uniref:50S ribosomal protein L6 n=1 Tax=Bakuella subtropica TaxID=1295181 RepID=UPI0023F3B142|nr:50S ribosomal protein L6 [Bakuella subtropica]WDY80870.1 50S ribosomal protein L6 [Bakuella subtropica]